MRKRKINPQFLKRITAQDVKDEEIAVVDFAKSLKDFADEFLGGIIELEVEGFSAGSVSLKLPIASYLIRLICECGDSDDLIKARITISDELALKVEYKTTPPTEDVAHIVKVARLAGFTPKRSESTLVFTADIKLSSIMQIYATSADDFRDMLIITHKM